MKLIGEKWAEYVQEKKGVLEGLNTTKENMFAQLTKLDLYKFSFNILEGYHDMDSGLENDFDFKLSFIIVDEQNETSAERITVVFGDEFVSFVELNPKDHLEFTKQNDDSQDNRPDLTDYFGLDKANAYTLEKVFAEFAYPIVNMHAHQISNQLNH